jgi:hypothetical protein
MPIATTHEQYYQLNMNPNDIVVWYCLAGSAYTIPNDVRERLLHLQRRQHHLFRLGTQRRHRC